MKKLFFFTVLLTQAIFVNGQNFKTDQGGLEALVGIERYHIVFEYNADLVVPKYDSEAAFLESKVNERESKETGAGEEYKELWYKNRIERYEPRLIQEFNYFNLQEKQVTVAREISDSKYTMVVRTLLTDPGNSNFFFRKAARLEITITIFETENPENVLYSTQMVDVHSRGANSDDFNRIISAYAELGRGMSRHFSRKT